MGHNPAIRKSNFQISPVIIVPLGRLSSGKSLYRKCVLWYFLSCRSHYLLSGELAALAFQVLDREFKSVCHVFSIQKSFPLWHPPTPNALFSLGTGTVQVFLICSSCTKSFGSFTFENSHSLLPNHVWFRPSAARLSGLAGHFWNQQEPKPPCAIEPLRLPSPLGVVVIFPGQQGINGGIYSTFVPRQRSQAGGLCEARLGHPRG